MRNRMGTRLSIALSLFMYMEDRMELKPPLTFTEQVHRLKQHGMKFEDSKSVQHFLEQVNYYRFSGYALEFRTSPQSSQYREGTTFAHVLALYQFDEKLRHILRLPLEEAEVYYRTQIANVFACLKCQTSPHDQHYLEKNYYRKDIFHKLQKQIEREENYHRDSLIVQHHISKYQNRMPLWVLVELMSFSSLSKFYSCMYRNDQEAIAASIGTSARILGNHLHCMAVLRNRCAHAGRLYHAVFAPPVVFGQRFLRQHPEVQTNTFFAYLLMLIKRLPSERQQELLKKDVSELFEAHADIITPSSIGLPENWRTFLN